MMRTINMEYTFKGKVKKLIAKKDNYHVSFSYSDTIKFGTKELNPAFSDENNKSYDILQDNNEFVVEKELFDFISAHTKEELIIHYEGKDIKKVELIYE